MWEVIRAAATKPFGFLAHFPGPGAGGDCIPVLAHQLITSSRRVHVPLRVVEAAAIVNDLQPKHVAEKVSDMLKVNGIVNNHPKVLLIGITYKPDVADLRQSPALKVWQYLEARGLEVSYHDPYILRYNGATSRALTRTCVEEHDIIVITTPHKAVAYEHVLSARKPILDTHNVFNHRNLPYVSTLS
jgi:UDP-N-acetyl-D-glucosamine dehydrogenase